MGEIKYLLDCVNGKRTFLESKVKDLELLELYNILTKKVLDSEESLLLCESELDDLNENLSDFREAIEEVISVYESGDTGKFEELLNEISKMVE